MKYIQLIFCVSLLSTGLTAQTISNQVIASNGTSVSAGAFNLSYTVGDLVVSTLTTPGNIVTQGFHQTYNTTSSINDEDVNVSILVYPNPTYDQVNISIKTENQSEFQALVFDSYGRSVLTKSFSNVSSMQVDLSTIAAGTYYIQLSQINTGIPIKTIQIQKLSHK